MGRGWAEWREWAGDVIRGAEREVGGVCENLFSVAFVSEQRVMVAG